MTTTPTTSTSALDQLLDKAHVITYVFLIYAIGGLVVVIAHPEREQSQGVGTLWAEPYKLWEGVRR
jgi:hypothetical protein